MSWTAARSDRAAANPLVELDDVSKSFGPKHALRNVSFAVPRGPGLRLARPERGRQNHLIPAADGGC